MSCGYIFASGPYCNFKCPLLPALTQYLGRLSGVNADEVLAHPW